MYKAKAYSAASATSPLATDTINRRDTTDTDVQIEILFCGICHSDLHTVRNEWVDMMPTTYPAVPGHEIVGKVTAVVLRSPNTRWVRSSGWAAWSTRITRAPATRRTWSSSAPKESSPTTLPTSISAE